MTSARTLPAPLALGGAVAVGVMTTIQARLNGALGVRLSNGVVAGLISFGSGLILVAVIVLLLPAGRRGMRVLGEGIRGRRVPLWMLLGGLCGSFTVSAQGTAAGIIGVSLFTVGVVAGQTLHGLVLDRAGIGPAGVVAITRGRLAGGALALVAVAVSLGGDVLARVPLWMLVMPVLAGIGIAWQQAANGRLAQRIASPTVATLVNFIAGTTGLLLAAGVSVLVQGPPSAPPAELWLYLGGALGVAYIFLGALLVAHTGVLLLGLGSVLGQIIAAVVIDLLWPPAQAPALWQVVAMAATATASVVIAVIRRR